MFSNVIIGVDLRQGGRDAIALAARLAEQDAGVTLVHVLFGDPRFWGADPAGEPITPNHVLEQLARVRDEAGVTAEVSCPTEASVGRGLHLAAESAGADLLVVGSSRRGLLGRVLLGDDTHDSLNGAPCAVAIAPAGYAGETAPLREVGVGYNGSLESEHALAVARALAGQHHAKVSAFEAVALPAYLYMGGGPALMAVPIEGIVEEARGRLAELGGVEAHAAYGQAAEELAVYSASLDLLVVGSRDYGPVGRLVHGSTTHQLARMSRCPLLVLTRAARAPN